MKRVDFLKELDEMIENTKNCRWDLVEKKCHQISDIILNEGIETETNNYFAARESQILKNLAHTAYLGYGDNLLWELRKLKTEVSLWI